MTFQVFQLHNPTLTKRSAHAKHISLNSNIDSPVNQCSTPFLSRCGVNILMIESKSLNFLWIQVFLVMH